MTLLLLCSLTAAPNPVAPPANWGVEIRLGPYQPQYGTNAVGAEHDEHDYYETYYKDDRPLMIGLEFDRYLTYFYGLVGVFFQASYWKVAGHTRVCQVGNDIVACEDEAVFNSSPGNGKTTLVIIPLSLGVVYRADYLYKKWQIPLAGYAKLAFDWFLWTENGRGVRGGSEGDTIGFHGAVGLALNLNWIEARESLKHRVFADSYFFAEARQFWGDAFGHDESFDMSATQFNFGLSFEFE